MTYADIPYKKTCAKGSSQYPVTHLRSNLKGICYLIGNCKWDNNYNYCFNYIPNPIWKWFFWYVDIIVSNHMVVMEKNDYLIFQILIWWIWGSFSYHGHDTFFFFFIFKNSSISRRSQGCIISNSTHSHAKMFGISNYNYTLYTLGK